MNELLLLYGNELSYLISQDYKMLALKGIPEIMQPIPFILYVRKQMPCHHL